MPDQQIVTRWHPLADIPETPCADFVLESLQAGQLSLGLRYSQIAGNTDRDLTITFSDVLALRIHWDGDAPVVGRLVDPPHCANDEFSRCVWPLLIVKNSRWLASGDFDTSVAIAAGMNKEPWQQFTVAALERSIDIIARGEVFAKWVSSKSYSISVLIRPSLRGAERRSNPELRV
jgi:hypothetical protein